MNIVDKYGQNAGKIWGALNKYGALTEKKLMESTKLTGKDFYAAIGWLARENKICKVGASFKLGETNLTSKIGEDAGEIWKTLHALEEVDISSIAKLLRIKEKDVYSALGWLFREGKILAKKIKLKEPKMILTLK
jgi:hypothetical protein